MEVVNRTNWAIGDWLTYGDGRGEYGQTYVEAARITGRSFESLSQSARVSREFPIDHRGYPVPWSIYRESLRLDPGDRDHALRAAVQQRWTRDQFAHYCIEGEAPELTSDAADVLQAEAIRRGNPEPTRSARRPHFSRMSWRPARKTNHHRRVTCPKCHHVFEPRDRES